MRRFNNVETFTGLGVYAVIRYKEGMSKDETVELSVKIKRWTVVAGMEDPMFKLAGSDGEGYPMESLFVPVNAVNNPQ